ncbi:hypothetical protein MGSAQ_003341, partial [marine sediment metagenome]
MVSTASWAVMITETVEAAAVFMTVHVAR